MLNNNNFQLYVQAWAVRLNCDIAFPAGPLREFEVCKAEEQFRGEGGPTTCCDCCRMDQALVELSAA